MRVSQNEVYRLAQRALEAAGAPFGVDRDGAFATAWLEARRLPGLDLLAVALDRMSGPPAPLAAPSFDGRTGRLELAGQPAVLWAGALVDCLELVAAGAGSEPAVLTVRRCRWPLFLLPLAARRAAGGKGLRVLWRYGEAAVICIADPPGRCRIVLEGAPIDLAQVLSSSGPVEVRLREPDSPVRRADRSRRTEIVDAETLDAALRRTLTGGIEVADALWARIEAYARRVLVPASDLSRVRGAGGGDANE